MYTVEIYNLVSPDYDPREYTVTRSSMYSHPDLHSCLHPGSQSDRQLDSRPDLYPRSCLLSHLGCRQTPPLCFQTMTFTSQAELFCYVRSFDVRSRRTKAFLGNTFLEAVMCNPNDRRRGKDTLRYLRGYLTKDWKGRVIDLRLHTEDIMRFDLSAYFAAKRAHLQTVFELWLEAREAFLARQNTGLNIRICSPGERVYNYDKHLWWLPFRLPRTIQERRVAVATEHKPFVRGKRSDHNLPNPDDEYMFTLQRTWKAKTKVKRQWLVNKPIHIGTIKGNTFNRSIRHEYYS